MKKMIFVSIIMLMALVTPIMTACGDDNDNDNKAIGEYVGKWICSSPSSRESTIVKQGTILVITSSGDMAWTMTDGSKYAASMRALGDDWADITLNGKTYRAEIYTFENKANTGGKCLVINVNGNKSLKVKDFPFDGSYNSAN